QWEKQTSDLEAMVRSAFNGTGKGRMTSDMKTRVQNPPRSLVLVTAENELQTDSVPDRMLTLYTDHGGGLSNTRSDDPPATPNTPRSLVVVAAENELQIASVRARMLTLSSDDGGGFINPRSADPLATLNTMSRRGDQARLSAQMLRWMCDWAARDSYKRVRTT